MADAPLSLSSGFDDASEADWLAGVEKALKGGGIDRITRETVDGIKIHPLYRESHTPTATDPRGVPGTAPYLRGATSTPDAYLPWDIRQAFTHPDPVTTNAEILRDLERGVSSVEIKHDCTGRTGVQLCQPDDFGRALTGVRADIAPIALDHGGGTGTSGAALLALWAKDQPGAKLAFNIDPLGALARSGLVDSGLGGAFQRLSALFTPLTSHFANATLLRSDARPIHEAGGSETQELAALIASGVDTLRRLEEVGIAPSIAAPHILFTLSLDANYGVGVAKLSAARRLWARCLDAMEVDAHPMLIHGYSSARMLTRYDPWVNMLRGTAACFAGAIGGADVITVRPFNSALGTPEELGRRVARNTQIIAMEESQLGRVADPAGGAWFTETLANDLAEAAWAEVQQIEREGGYGASLMADAFQARVAAARAERMKQIAKRKAPITGVSEFPQLDGIGAPVADLPPVTAKDGISPDGLKHFVPSWSAPDSAPSEAEPFWPIRLAEPYERLRDIANTRSPRPSIFVATLGPVAEHTGRVDFARNLFAAGGIDAKEAPALPHNAADLAVAFKASGCRLAVICGADTRYESEASDAAAALKAAGCQRVYLAGKSETEGVDSHIYLGVDVVHTLELAHAELGLNPSVT